MFNRKGIALEVGNYDNIVNHLKEIPMALVTFIADQLQLIMQLAHHFGSRNIYRVLIFKSVALVAGEEIKQMQVVYQLLKLKLMLCSFIQVIEFEGVEVAHNDVAGQLMVFQSGKVIRSLPVSSCQIFASALVLYQERALPQQVNIAIPAVLLRYPVLEAGDPPAGDAEDVEELVPEGLSLCVLAAILFPLLGEGNSAGLDLVET